MKIEWLLGRFLDYLEERNIETIGTDDALAWAILPGGAPAWHAVRHSAVRGFASYLQTIDPTCEVPPRLLAARLRRSTPYIYTERELALLLEATSVFRTPHRSATYRTLIGLLSVTGMRIGEAIALDEDDVDLGAEFLLVRDTKFGKTRELPLHPSTAAALDLYRRREDRPPSSGTDDAFLVSMKGNRLDYGSAPLRLQEAPRPGRDQAALGGVQAEAARPAPHLRGPHPAGCLPRRRRRRGPDRDPRHLPRPQRAG